MELLPHFAHNPTIRANKDGTYTIFYIGGWASNASSCSTEDGIDAYGAQTRQLLYKSAPRSAHLAYTAADSAAGYNCSEDAVLDPPTSIRVGGDYLTVQLKPNATIQDCVTSCCGDIKCFAFRCVDSLDKSTMLIMLWSHIPTNSYCELSSKIAKYYNTPCTNLGDIWIDQEMGWVYMGSLVS